MTPAGSASRRLMRFAVRLGSRQILFHGVRRELGNAAKCKNIVSTAHCCRGNSKPFHQLRCYDDTRALAAAKLNAALIVKN